jgi:hypothetical protein
LWLDGLLQQMLARASQIRAERIAAAEHQDEGMFLAQFLSIEL